VISKLLKIFNVKSLTVYQLTLILLSLITLLLVLIISISWISSDIIEKNSEIEQVQEYAFKKQSDELRAQVSIIISYLDHLNNNADESSIESVQSEALNYLESIRFGTNGYVFVNTYDGYSLLFNGKKLN